MFPYWEGEIELKREVRYEPLTAKAILNPVKAPSMPFAWSINPYRGCQHGCSFCYARHTHAFLGAETDDTFQNRIFVKTNAVATLKKDLDKLRRSGGDRPGLHVAIGTATDPYQPAEAKARLTRGCLELLAEYGVPVSVTTRSPLILRDLDLLQRLRLLSVNISVGTMNTQIWKTFEPSTPAPAKRLEAIAGLASAGLPVGVFMAPILPDLTDAEDDLRDVMTASARSGAVFVMASCLRLSTPEVKSWFMQAIGTNYPHLRTKYEHLYGRSGYAPAWYRDALRERACTIRRELGLRESPSSEPLEPRERTISQRAQPPEQLAFSF